MKREQQLASTPWWWKDSTQHADLSYRHVSSTWAGVVLQVRVVISYHRGGEGGTPQCMGNHSKKKSSEIVRLESSLFYMYRSV